MTCERWQLFKQEEILEKHKKRFDQLQTFSPILEGIPQ